MSTMRVMAACHIHSDWSYDGTWSLDALAEKFKRRGYRILMVTEHDQGFSESVRLRHREACARTSSEEFLVLPGIEYSDANNRVHVLVWGQVPFCGEASSTTAILEAVKATDGIAVLAHPSRKNVRRLFEPRWAELLTGIELWNRKFDGWSPSKAALQLLRTSGAAPFVGMDFHSLRQLFPLSMVLDIENDVTEESVLDCLRLRRFCPCILGFPINNASLSGTLPLLLMAELLRRTIARMYRRLRRGQNR